MVWKTRTNSALRQHEKRGLEDEDKQGPRKGATLQNAPPELEGNRRTAAGAKRNASILVPGHSRELKRTREAERLEGEAEEREID